MLQDFLSPAVRHGWRLIPTSYKGKGQTVDVMEPKAVEADQGDVDGAGCIGDYWVEDELVPYDLAAEHAAQPGRWLASVQVFRGKW